MFSFYRNLIVHDRGLPEGNLWDPKELFFHVSKVTCLTVQWFLRYFPLFSHASSCQSWMNMFFSRAFALFVGCRFLARSWPGFTYPGIDLTVFDSPWQWSIKHDEAWATVGAVCRTHWFMISSGVYTTPEKCWIVIICTGDPQKKHPQEWWLTHPQPTGGVV